MDSYKETFETWNKVAKVYEDKFMDLDLYNDTYDAFCENIGKKDASILEIGSGPGNITKYLLSKKPDLKIEGTDVSENMIELAKKNNPGVMFSILDCRNLDQLTQKFDGIVCGFCIPYLSETDTLKMVDDCAGLLNNNGILYLSFVEGDYLKSGFQTSSSGDRAYFYFHSTQKLISELKNHGFGLINLFEKVYKRSITTEEIHSVVIARKLSLI
ncbi:class I SAM-dependent DNA methyltransferase [Pedobacter sp. PWIIR3]